MNHFFTIFWVISIIQISPTSIPTPAPVASVDKYICAKNDPGDTEICSTGTFVGSGECTANDDSCGKNGRKTCYLATNCPGDGPPGPSSPTPTPPPLSPPTTCPVCGDGFPCCTTVGTCETSGKPSDRNCIPN